MPYNCSLLVWEGGKKIRKLVDLWISFWIDHNSSYLGVAYRSSLWSVLTAQAFEMLSPMYYFYYDHSLLKLLIEIKRFWMNLYIFGNTALKHQKASALYYCYKLCSLLVKCPGTGFIIRLIDMILRSFKFKGKNKWKVVTNHLMFLY